MLARHANTRWCSPSAHPPPHKRNEAVGVAEAGHSLRVGKDKALDRHRRREGPSQGGRAPRWPVVRASTAVAAAGAAMSPSAVGRGDALAHHRHGRACVCSTGATGRRRGQWRLLWQEANAHGPWRATLVQYRRPRIHRIDDSVEGNAPSPMRLRQHALHAADVVNPWGGAAAPARIVTVGWGVPGRQADAMRECGASPVQLEGKGAGEGAGGKEARPAKKVQEGGDCRGGGGQRGAWGRRRGRAGGRCTCGGARTGVVPGNSVTNAPPLRKKPGGQPASPKRNRHTRLTIPVLWHPLAIDCRAESDAGVGWGRGRRKQHGKERGRRGAWAMVRGGGSGCLVQSVQADYSTFLANATYMQL